MVRQHYYIIMVKSRLINIISVKKETRLPCVRYQKGVVLLVHVWLLYSVFWGCCQCLIHTRNKISSGSHLRMRSHCNSTRHWAFSEFTVVRYVLWTSRVQTQTSELWRRPLAEVQCIVGHLVVPNVSGLIYTWWNSELSGRLDLILQGFELLLELDGDLCCITTAHKTHKDWEVRTLRNNLCSCRTKQKRGVWLQTAHLRSLPVLLSG